MSPILKRDNMGYDIAPAAIVVLCMCGAGVLLVMCYAASRLFMSVDSNGLKPLTVDQHEYMATVRARNLDILASEARMSRRLVVGDGSGLAKVVWG
ncbi:hypothetical protein K458DRAFT_396759 [Lentithecium fluviatile CBS 122367]|uniref:Uncharacterized protein n=1 Tax=Lentithecium fluviatile CBS 122367 TaxID=1168545 RepID=A0A6G1IFC1_9PLEO|nr:hypothetical protein K458DRAFT_396759 [Lentithecium fluviatile CBS 122367]